MVIEAMSISFGRVSTTLQGNFTGSRGLVSNSSFLLSPLLYREKFDDLVNSFRGKLGTGRGEMAEDVYRGGRILLISVRDRYLTKLMGKVCYVDRFKGEIEVYTSKNSCGEISFDWFTSFLRCRSLIFFFSSSSSKLLFEKRFRRTR